VGEDVVYFTGGETAGNWGKEVGRGLWGFAGESFGEVRIEIWEEVG
jgi:hypothetical protein